MAKLYFKYGAMGSSKTAQALITKFNYESGYGKVLLLKPSIDNRDGKNTVKSRIGLQSEAIVVKPDDIITDIIIYNMQADINIKAIIIDEAQFLTEEQVTGLKNFVISEYGVNVLCYGLLTDFTTHLFPGSKRLIELADSIQEIKMVCDCGNKAQVNARLVNGKVTTHGEQVLIGGNESYKAMCYSCYVDSIEE